MSINRVLDKRLNTIIKLQKLITTLQAELAIVKTERDGLQQALYQEQNKRKRNKNLFEQLRAEDDNAAIIFSPQKTARAKEIQREKELETETIKEAKAIQKEKKEQNLLAQQATAQLVKEQRY